MRFINETRNAGREDKILISKEGGYILLGMLIMLVAMMLGTCNRTYAQSSIEELESQGYTVLDSTETEQLLIKLIERDTLLAQVKDYQLLDSNYREQIRTLKELNLTRSQLTPAKPDKSLFEWQGFYLGISTTYGIDSNVLHNTVLGNLRFAIYGTARVRIGLVELWAGYEIPFDDKLKIKIGAGYRIF